MTAKIHIVSVLGGPGSGKGTHCALLQKSLFCAHLSVGDVLRAEAAKPESPYASIIEENMRLGRVGPKEITVGILQKHIEEGKSEGTQTFLLDGALAPLAHPDTANKRNQGFHVSSIKQNTSNTKSHQSIS